MSKSISQLSGILRISEAESQRTDLSFLRLTSLLLPCGFPPEGKNAVLGQLIIISMAVQLLRLAR